jgi:hypothetical protein
LYFCFCLLQSFPYESVYKGRILESLILVCFWSFYGLKVMLKRCVYFSDVIKMKRYFLVPVSDVVWLTLQQWVRIGYTVGLGSVENGRENYCSNSRRCNIYNTKTHHWTWSWGTSIHISFFQQIPAKLWQLFTRLLVVITQEPVIIIMRYFYLIKVT